MKRSINKWDFRDAFRDCGRNDSFSYDGLGLLFDWFEQYEDDCDTETELDVIAICCDFSEEPADDIAANYDIDLSDCEDEDDIIVTVEEYLQDNTMLVGQTDAGDFIYASF